jgi:HEAT repeat protein
MNLLIRLSNVVLVFLALGFMYCPVSKSQERATEKNTSESEEEQIKRIGARMDRIGPGILGQISFTMMHCGGIEAHTLFMKTVGVKEDHRQEFSFKSAVREAGGLAKYRRHVAGLLTNDNIVVRGYGAQWLGMIGDETCKDDLVRLLKTKNDTVNYEKMSKDDLIRLIMEKKVGFMSGDLSKEETDKTSKDEVKANLITDETFKEEIRKISKDELIAILQTGERDILDGFDREQAAVGLGMLHAREYAKDLAALLKDPNGRIRAGAVNGLGIMEAKEYVEDIAKVLDFKSVMDPYAETACASAIIVLTKLQVKEQIPAIAKRLGEHSAVGNCALYALVALDAKDQQRHISELLKDDFKAGDAAVALALLGATEYVDSINDLLKKKENEDLGFVRLKAVFALGVLQAKEHIPDIVEFMKTANDHEKVAGAWALVMMESQEHAADAVKIIKQQNREDFQDLWMMPEEGEFLAAPRFYKVEQQAVKSFAKLQEEIEKKNSDK